jgi:transcription initiation factor TFIIB
MDETHDWRNFADNDQDNARAGMVDPYAGGQMTTRFAAGNSKQSQALAQSHNKYNLDTTMRNLMEANDVITALGNTLNLTSHIQAKAKELYREYEKLRKSSMRKASCRPLMVAIVYIACNQEGFGRTVKELAKSTGVIEKEIRSYYKTLMKILPNAATPPLDPSSLVDRFCARLSKEVPEFVKIGASAIARNAVSIIEGRQPATIAAGSLMLAAALASVELGCDDVATATTTISGSTVQSAYVQLSQHKTQIVPADFLQRAQKHRETIVQTTAKTNQNAMPAPSAPAPLAPRAAPFKPQLLVATPSTPSTPSTPALGQPLTPITIQKPTVLQSVPGLIPAHFSIKSEEMASSAPADLPLAPAIKADPI